MNEMSIKYSKNVLNYNFCGVINHRNFKFDITATIKTQMHAQKSFFFFFRNLKGCKRSKLPKLRFFFFFDTERTRNLKFGMEVILR